MKQDKEVWLRGLFIEDIIPLLQPVAHALLQAQEEITALINNFPDKLLWNRPGGNASPGFHLLHITGVLDRLLCYAEGKQLNEEQLAYLKEEVQPQSLTADNLLNICNEQIKKTIYRLKQFSEGMLTEARSVGRAALPSTVIGLCTHAAEHTMRHVGQLLVTVKNLKQSDLWN